MTTRLLLAAAFATSTSLLAGCPLAASCGAYDGGGDQVYTRGADMMIVCTNGGYSATLGTRTQEGIVGAAGLTDGPTGGVISSFTVVDASASAFGDGAWTSVTLDQTALDHADVMCSDLATRSWWALSALPAPVSFLFVEPDTSIAHVLALCPDGSATLTVDGLPAQVGSYSAVAGQLYISQFDGMPATDLVSQLSIGGDVWVIDEPVVTSCK